MNATGEVRTVLERMLPLDHGPYNLHEPELSDLEKQYVAQVLDEGFVSYAGRQVTLFEEALAKSCGAAECVAVVSGTVALQMMLVIEGIGEGDEVLCPSLTFAATANAIVHAGATPHFVDSSPKDLGIDVARLDRYLERIGDTDNDGRLINRATGRRIAGVVPVHIFGHIGDMRGLAKLAERWGFPVLEDAAEALGSTGNDCTPGSLSRTAALSFNGNKIVTTGGGGAILTNDADLAKRLRYVTTTAKLPHPWRFHHDEVGYNFRLPNINAALGLAQVERLPAFVERKRLLADAYMAAFADAAHWRPLREPEGCHSNYWLNAVLLDDPDMELLEATLEDLHGAGYRCRPAWTPMHQLKIHADHPRDELPVAESMAARILCLPSNPRLVEVMQ